MNKHSQDLFQQLADMGLIVKKDKGNGIIKIKNSYLGMIGTNRV
jgi:hypothetical protein